MADQIEDSVFDDTEAIEFIQAHLPQEVQGKYTDDDIVLITDTMYEYFERNGWADSGEEMDIDVEDLVEFVSKTCKKDTECKFDTDPESIRWVIEAELDYEESLG